MILKRLPIGVLAVLSLFALGSWSWYFFTKAPQNVRQDIIGRRSAPSTPPAAQAWRAASSKERSLAIASIQAQLNAFKADDYQSAAKYQSQGLKANFPSVEKFRDLIQKSYPEFAHFKTAKFGASRATVDGQNVTVPIILTGQNNRVVHAQYSMTKERAGYRVAGVSGGRAPSTDPAPDVPPGLKKIAPIFTAFYFKRFHPKKFHSTNFNVPQSWRS